MPILLTAITLLFFWGSLVLIFLCAAFILFFARFHKNQAHLILEKKSLQYQFQEQLLQAQIEIQEQTLKSISQEIHDNIGQTLSLVKLNLHTMELQKAENANDKILSSKQLVSKAILDLRNLSKTLNKDSILVAGLVDTVQFELDMIRKSDVFQTHFIIEGVPHKLDPQKELILFRIVQEALNNIIKHANATSIDIQMTYTTDIFSLSVKDNGSGFTNSGGRGGLLNGSGLRNMQNRAELIGGTFFIDGSPGNGTAIFVSLPVI